REMNQAATLMWALFLNVIFHIVRGNHLVATARVREPLGLAEEKGAFPWKAGAIALEGCASILTGKASDAIQMITSGIAAWRSAGTTMFEQLYLSHLAKAHVKAGQLGEAWRYIDEAIAAVEAAGERWCEA